MNNKRNILLHACCASCATYVMERLLESYRVTAYYYNPNIQPEKEHSLRMREMGLVCEKYNAELITTPYDPSPWEEAVGPYRDLPEKSVRCRECYRARIDETARKAVELGMASFATTLSVSPHKIYRWISELGKMAAAEYGIAFHDEDFKKKDGFGRSVILSREMNLTRQDYCGCLLSLEESKRRSGSRHGGGNLE